MLLAADEEGDSFSVTRAVLSRRTFARCTATGEFDHSDRVGILYVTIDGDLKTTTSSP